MKRYAIVVVMLGLIFSYSIAIHAETMKDHFQVLERYGLVENEGWYWKGQMIESFNQLLAELEGYSSEPHHLFLDLIDTLYKYGQAQGQNWKRYDLHRLAWAIKDFHNQMVKQADFKLTHGMNLGLEMEVSHTYGQGLYRNPYQHDLDGDGLDDVYDEDEYIRQYLDLQFGFTNPRMDGAVNIRGGLNYFGTGYIQNQGIYDKQYDLTYPEFKDLTFSMYGPYFTATFAEDQILGLRDYVYYDDPENPDDTALSGITFQAPFGIFFGLGQESWLNRLEPAKTHDVRWIAVGTQGLGFLPFGFYLTEQEFQDPTFHKVGRNVIFSLNTDLKNDFGKVSGDLAINDSGDGYYLQLNGETTWEDLHLTAAGEVTEHFTPIQPKAGFTNSTYERKFKDGSLWEFPARHQRGYQIQADYPVLEGLELFSGFQSYLAKEELEAGFRYQPLADLKLEVTGTSDFLARGVVSVWANSTYQHHYGQIELGTRLNRAGVEQIKVTAEPKYENSQVTVQGLLGYDYLPTTDEKNSQIGVLFEYHPIEDFTFTADYRIEDMQFDVDSTGLNFVRNGSIEYQVNEWTKAHVTFENVEYRGAEKYLVEYTNGGIQIVF